LNLQSSDYKAGVLTSRPPSLVVTLCYMSVCSIYLLDTRVIVFVSVVCIAYTLLYVVCNMYVIHSVVCLPVVCMS